MALYAESRNYMYLHVGRMRWKENRTEITADNNWFDELNGMRVIQMEQIAFE